MWYRSIFNDYSDQNNLQKESKIEIDLDNDTIQGEQSEPEELVLEKSAFVEKNEENEENKKNEENIEDVFNQHGVPDMNNELTDEQSSWLQYKFKFNKKDPHDVEKLKEELNRLGIPHLYNKALNELKELGRRFNDNDDRKKYKKRKKK